MASVVRIIQVGVSAADAWDAVRDFGALHTRLAPGFVIDAKLEAGARVVTFANGMSVREPLVTRDDDAKRLVWSAEGGRTTHYNSAVQVFEDGEGARLVWTSDFLPDAVQPAIAAAMDAGAAAIAKALKAPA